MAESAQELEAREKKELVSKEEKTVPARYFVPSTDIHETEDALIVVMEVPGVEKKDIAVDLENDVLRIDARIDTGKYQGLQPLYTEYNVGHFARSFTLSGTKAPFTHRYRCDVGARGYPPGMTRPPTNRSRLPSPS